jgi:hypothetical protein
MCGIFAILGLTAVEPHTYRRRAVELSRRIRHRGPDAENCHTDDHGNYLCFQRLAIMVSPGSGSRAHGMYRVHQLLDQHLALALANPQPPLELCPLSAGSQRGFRPAVVPQQGHGAADLVGGQWRDLQPRGAQEGVWAGPCAVRHRGTDSLSPITEIMPSTSVELSATVHGAVGSSSPPQPVSTAANASTSTRGRMITVALSKAITGV